MTLEVDSSMQSPKPRKLLANYVLLSGGEAISKFLAFLAFAYLARVLGPDAYGGIEFAIAVTMFFTLVAEGGLGLLGAREIAKDENSLKILTIHIVVIRTALAIGAFLLLLIFITLSSKTSLEKHLVILFGLQLFWTPGLLQWIFQGLDWMRWVALCSAVRWLFFAGGIFVFVSKRELVLLVPLIELAAIGLVVVLNVCIFRRFFDGLKINIDFAYGFHLLRQAIPIGLTQIMWGLKIYLPTIMLGLLIGGKTVGWFGAGYRIVLALHAFVWMYFFNIFPSISRYTKQSFESLRNFITRSLQLTSWAGVFIGIMGTLFAKPIISLVYGPQYNESASGFQYLIWLISFTLISGHFMYILIAYNRQWLELLSASCGAVVSIALNLLLIPRYGYLGAAWTVLLAEAFIWVLYYYFVRREVTDIRFWMYLAKPLVAGGIIIIGFQFVRGISFWISGIICVIVYGLALFGFQPGIIKHFRKLVIMN
jgi:O-antigen/teichoic acid export membrane protein